MNYVYLVESIRILTFPGVFVHECAHEIACRLLRVPVHTVYYFRMQGEVLGYVRHSGTRNFKNFFIAIAPGLVGPIIGLAIVLPAALSIINYEADSVLDWFMLWVGTSILVHACPSPTDCQAAVEALVAQPTLIRLLLLPVEFVVRVLGCPFSYAGRAIVVSMTLHLGPQLFIGARSLSDVASMISYYLINFGFMG